MYRRHFLAAAAGAAITLQAGMLRSQPLRDPLSPWAEAAIGHPDPRIAAMGWAVLAPNPHNRQPWALRLLDGYEALLFCDLERRLPVTDPFDRQIVIGLGCFLELFRLAAADAGWITSITPFPEGEPAQRLDGRPVAHLRLSRGARRDPLFDHALQRRSAKQPFAVTRNVPMRSIDVLRDALLQPAGLGTRTEAVGPLRALVWEAWEIDANDPVAHQESVDLMRMGSAAVAAQPDGISLWGPELDPMVAAGRLTHAAMASGQPGFALMSMRYRAMLEATNAYVWLHTPDNSRAGQLAAGRDWLRLNLAATGAGLGLHPVSQALQEYAAMNGPRTRLAELLGAPGVPQMLGRLGHPTQPAPPTPRWPSESRILTG